MAYIVNINNICFRNLSENIELLTDGKQNRRILVPFCGKSLDLLW